jgi:2-methylaconitate isomerase
MLRRWAAKGSRFRKAWRARFNSRLAVLSLAKLDLSMALMTIPATFMRGGTSKALMIHRHDLPTDVADWAPILLSALGSPDPYGRQLNGMGGGLSSVSKVCVVETSDRSDADVDYTFVQVVVKADRIDMSGNCGNMLAAVGPFAVDEGLVKVEGAKARVRIFNTNTQKLIHAEFDVESEQSVYEGDLIIPGVAGTGAPIRLDFIQPGGATTGKLLPTGEISQILQVHGVGEVEVSLIDAANACVFVNAASIGLQGNELPAELETIPGLLDRLAKIRIAGSVAMGIGSDPEQAATIIHVPFLCIVSEPQGTLSTSGDAFDASDMDLTVRVISNGAPHQALPLTATLCTAVAAHLPSSVVERVARGRRAGRLRVGMPSGVLTAEAVLEKEGDHFCVGRGSFYRTARPLMKGFVFVHAVG